VTPENDYFPTGVKLTRTELGGMAVTWNGTLIGWIHASYGDRWNAYLRDPTKSDWGTLLGRFTELEAVRRIALEAGWREQE
jgi:hypothetical protein